MTGLDAQLRRLARADQFFDLGNYVLDVEAGRHRV